MTTRRVAAGREGGSWRRTTSPVALLVAVMLGWAGTNSVPAASAGGASAAGNVLVVMAHPDDEALAAAGVIAHARSEGRRVYVAIATNGDSRPGPGGATYCGAASAQQSAIAQHGLIRDAETIAAMDLLGLSWSTNVAESDIFFLGYPDDGLVDVAQSGTSWTGDQTGLHRTYAEDGDGSPATCNGDFRYLLSGRHSLLTASDLAADFESLLTLTNPTDVYTHANFDGHPDHTEVYQQIVAAAQRLSLTPVVHAALVHPEGTEHCGALSAFQWPNPSTANNDPFARFTPHLDVTAPPVPTCDPSPTSTSWGTAGPPNELVEVPLSMQAPTEADNLKWRVISEYVTQIDCTPGSTYSASCGYMRAFVKKHEFFWTSQVALPAPPPPGSNRFGIATVGPLLDRPTHDFKFGSVHTLAEPATLVAFNFYARGGAASQRFVPVVYAAGAGGNPAGLVAEGAEVTVAAGSVAGWRTATLPAVLLPAGPYLLGVLSGPSNGGATLYYSAAADGGFYNSNPYPVPSANWGTTSSHGSIYSFYVDYLPQAPDAIAPQASVTEPASGAVLSGTATVTATATDNVGVARVDLLVDGAVAGTDTVSPYSFDLDTTALPDGAHSLVARAFDGAGNAGSSPAVPVTVSNVPVSSDTENPAASLTSPAAGATVSGTASLSANATDNVGIARVEFLVDGAVVGNDTTTPYAVDWDSRSVANGPRAVTARAYDAAGNAGTSAPHSITVDNASLRVFGDSIVGPLTDQPGAGYRFGSPFTLHEAAQELAAFRFHARGGSAAQRFIPLVYAVDAAGAPTDLVAQGAEVTVAAGAAPGWFSGALPAMAVPPGRYLLALLSGPSSGGSVLYFASEAGAGMYHANAYPAPATSWGQVNAINARYSFNVEYLPGAADTQAPAAEITAPAPGATVSGTATVTATVVDDAAVIRAELLVNGAVVATDTTSPYSFAWDTTTLANGSHSLVVRGHDVAGNAGTSATVTVSVSNVSTRTFGAESPGAQLDVPPAGYRFGSVFGVPETAVVSEFRYYARGGSSNQAFVPLIYAVDGAGNPANLVAQGAETVVAAGSPAGWRTAPLPASTLPAGNYLLAVLAGPGSGGATLYYAAEAGAGRWAANPYPVPAPNWGPVNVGGARYSFAVVYQPPVQDTEPPSGAVTSPAIGATVSGVVDLMAVATDNIGVAAVDFLVDGVLVGTDTTSPYAVPWDTRTVPNGEVGVTARIRDGAGNLTTTAPVPVTVQNEPPPADPTSPTVTVTAPAGGATVAGLTTIAATASDNVGVTRVEFLAGGVLVGTDTTSPYATSWDTTTTANGAVSLLARAFDAAGNVGSSATVPVTVSNADTRTFGGTVAGGQTDQPGSGYKFGSSFPLFERAILASFRFHAAGGAADQAFVPAVYAVDAAGAPTSLVATGAQVTVAAGSPASWRTATLPGSTLEPGTYVLAMVSGPASGGARLHYTPDTDAGVYNLNAFPTPSASWGTVGWANARYSFYVEYAPAAPDTESPAVALTAPAHGATVSAVTELTATATDDSAVTSVEFLLDGALLATDTTSPYAFAWDTATVPNGSKVLLAKAYDVSGNVGTSAAATVTVSNAPDNESPTVAIVSPEQGSTVSGLTTVTATAADNVRVTRVEFLVDGVVRSTVLSSPYTFAWDTATASTGTHHLVARAYDAPGNVGTSTTVTVNNVTAGPAVSDDFSGPLDATRWTFVNPLGDASVSVNGTQAEIAVPGGPSHYVWTGGAQAPRLMQTVANGDFEVEAKFQSSLLASTQLQGIMIEQDANNFVRFDISRVDSHLELAGATVAGTSGTGWFVRDVRGGADVYMRVRRTGNSWTLRYSYDGQAWTNSGTFTRALTVNRVGPFAGNSSPGGASAPAFVAKVDYFVNRATPPATDDGVPFVPPAAPPVIDVWYGDAQAFGANGRPQEWVNVLGRVSDPDGVASLTYSLNGGAEQVLSMGENTVRLVSPGDFNVEVGYAALNAGANTVRIRAVDVLGTVTLRTVTVNHVAGATAPVDYSIDWSETTDINSVAQVTDGQWALLPDGTVRTTEIGYDRLIALGDIATWTDYEVSAELTIWDMPASGAAVGLVAGWTGHTTDQYGVPAPDQPRVGHPFPVFASYLQSRGQSARLSIGANTAAHQEAELIGDTSGRQLTLGVPYVFKLRTHANAAGGSTFSFKVWRVGTPEPTAWDLVIDGDRSQGAVLLGAHGGDVSFGAVTVTGL